MVQKINLALVYGSARTGRFCDTVAGWAGSQIMLREDFELSVIDPAGFPAGLAAGDAEASGLRAKADRAEAFVVAVPEYNHGYPAALKALIDSIQEEWRAKPVAFVSYGGVSGGLRAVEQLRQVFAELHAMTIRETVSFHMAWNRFDAAGRPKDQACGEALHVMLDQLAWWALALREAKLRRPYGKQVLAA